MQYEMLHQMQPATLPHCDRLQILCVCEPVTSGVPVYVEQIVRSMEGERFHFTVACPPNSILKSRLKNSPVTLVEMDLQRGATPFTEIRALGQMWRLLRRQRFDLVHLHSSIAGLVGRPMAALFGVPTIFTPHCFCFESARHDPLKFSLYTLAERLLGRLTDRLVCVSRSERELAVSGQIASRDSIVVIPGFADERRWDASSGIGWIRSYLGMDDHHKLIGTVSRFHRQKAPLDFVRMANFVLQQRSDVRFVLVGEDGPLRPAFERLVHEAGQDHLITWYPWTDLINEVVADFDIFALNSLWEGMPLSVIEAMTLGKPVVVPDLPCMRELMGMSECGLVSPVGRPDLMALNVQRLLDSPDLVRRFGENSMRRVRANYSLQHAVRQHHDMYLQLASNQHDPPSLANGRAIRDEQSVTQTSAH